MKEILLYIYIYIYICSSSPTVVEGDLKAPFSIATTQKGMGACYSFSWIATLTLDLYFIMLSVKQGDIKYHFLSFGDDNVGLNPSLPDH